MPANGDAPTPAGQINVGAFAAAVGGLATFVGGIALTGPLGRVIRNDGTSFKWAVGAVLLGTAFLVAAGLSTTERRTEIFLSIAGLSLVAAGFVIAGVVAVDAGQAHERPSITASLGDKLRSVTGKVTVGSLSSDGHAGAIVEGLVYDAKQNLDGAPQQLWRSELGPDQDGKAEIAFVAGLPAGRYDAVRIFAWTDESASDDEDKSAKAECAHAGRTANDEPAGTACVVLPLPSVPAGPTLEAQWTDGKADMVAVHVAGTNAPSSLSAAEAAGVRIAIVVKGRVGQGDAQYYRAILRPDPDGVIDTKFNVPVAPGPRRICVGAMYLTNGERPQVSCARTLNASGAADQAVVQLSRPAAAPPAVDPP